jgi:regulator of replication initiation timing
MFFFLTSAQHPNPDSQQTADDIYIRTTELLGVAKQGCTTMMEREKAFKKVVAALKEEAKRSLSTQMEHDKWRRRLGNLKKSLEEKERKEKVKPKKRKGQELTDSLDYIEIAGTRFILPRPGRCIGGTLIIIPLESELTLN